MRVLVAEDDEPTRSVLAEAVGALGYKCSLAVDGVEALDALRRGGYELLIADIKMPRMDGMELLRQARAPGDDPFYLAPQQFQHPILAELRGLADSIPWQVSLLSGLCSSRKNRPAP